MRKPIVWIISHSGVSRIKTFHRQIMNMDIFDSIYVYVHCATHYQSLSFNFNILAASAARPKSIVQTIMDSHIENYSDRLTLEELIIKIQEIKELPFVNHKSANLFIEANLGAPNLDNITQEFHLITQEIRKSLSCLPKIFSVDLQLYPCSQNKLCCKEANLYIRGHVTQSYMLNGITHNGYIAFKPLRGFSGDLQDLPGKLQEQHAALQRRVYCCGFFKSRSNASIIPVVRHETNKCNNVVELATTSLAMQSLCIGEIKS